MNKKVCNGYIEIKKDLKMHITEWSVFIFGSFVLLTISYSFLNLVKTFKNENMVLIYMICFMFVFFKLVNWLRVPSTYETEYIKDDLKQLRDIEGKAFRRE